MQIKFYRSSLLLFPNVCIVLKHTLSQVIYNPWKITRNFGSSCLGLLKLGYHWQQHDFLRVTQKQFEFPSIIINDILIFIPLILLPIPIYFLDDALGIFLVPLFGWYIIMQLSNIYEKREMYFSAWQPLGRLFCFWIKF